MKAIVGNYDAKVRSDCQASFELTQSGGVELILKSKVGVMYGDAIEKLARNILEFYEIKNCRTSKIIV